ncbi:MAG: GNAT family N-acetyltransferase [Hyphomicrobiaceae bacterium]|nr:GNAT family N-acetyltransferase [Hyphomicrobiaceae bacterium]
MADGDEPFLSRWSRLKREAKAPARSAESDGEPGNAAPAEPGGASAATGQDARPAGVGDSSSVSHPGEPALDLEKLDLDALDGNSDYKPFMSAGVPEEIRSKALAKLWLSDPALAGPEQLSDYMEDFTDAARAIAPGLLRTAYKVGQGFLSDEETAEWDRLGRSEPAPEAAGLAQITIAPESPDQVEIAAFLAASDAYAHSLYPPKSNHLVDLATLMAPNAHFVVARREGKALGCGALILAEDGSGEVKRMWVQPEARKQGVGQRLLEVIEIAARERGVRVLRLETGIRQPEAIGLYSRCGFIECEPFGSYQPDPLSRFMEKRLS